MIDDRLLVSWLVVWSISTFVCFNTFTFVFISSSWFPTQLNFPYLICTQNIKKKYKVQLIINQCKYEKKIKSSSTRLKVNWWMHCRRTSVQAIVCCSFVFFFIYFVANKCLFIPLYSKKDYTAWCFGGI